MVRVQDGANVGATQDAVQKALAAYPTQKVMTKGEYLDTINKMVDQILMMFYGLLAMSVLISIFGIVNTLVLSVHERTREIGMLRAIGATRRQLRQMVRYESVITAVIGGVLGTAVGIAMAYVIITQLGGGEERESRRRSCSKCRNEFYLSAVEGEASKPQRQDFCSEQCYDAAVRAATQKRLEIGLARVPPHYRDCRLTGFDSYTERLVEKVRLITNWANGDLETGLYLFGGVGTGKTHLAVGAMRVLLERGFAAGS